MLFRVFVRTYLSLNVSSKLKGQKKILLKPLNPEYEAIELSPRREENFRIVAEYLYSL
jgi:SOS-response transcriptional repressor LexA